MSSATAMTAKEADGLSPGVKALVLWLNENGFETTDSGDGSNHLHGMGCAVPYPMVAIVVRPDQLIAESIRLLELLETMGLVFGGEEGPQIQGTYDPADGTAVILLTNLLSRDIGL